MRPLHWNRVALAVLAGLFLAVPLRAQFPLGSPTPAASREARATVVVYNTADPSSAELAAYYVKRRHIPEDHVVGLQCPTSEDISRVDYDRTIAGPLRDIFITRGWWHVPPEPGEPVTDSTIRYVALIRGIPLKIDPVKEYFGDVFVARREVSMNSAAVDSELSVLGLRTRHISGYLNNPYYRSFEPFMDSPIAPILLVCRLDAPTPEIVRNMIDGGIAAEEKGLTGFAYIDLRGLTEGPLAEGDRWLTAAAVGLRKSGLPLVWDSSPDQFPVEFPMSHAALYLGWYSGDVAGPISRPNFQFEPGAIAVHIHSFSANTLRSTTNYWAGPLLAHGAAATLGNVFEPYLALTPNLDIFADHLRNGYNFADSAYASERVLSWMTTFIGDPLYRPFGVLPETPADAPPGPAREYAAYREGAHAWFGQGRAAGEKKLAAMATEMHSGIVWEGLGLLQWSVPDLKAASASFANAEPCYGATEDGLRTVLHRVEILKAGGKPGAASALAGRELPKFAGVQGVALLRSFAFQSLTAGRSRQ